MHHRQSSSGCHSFGPLRTLISSVGVLHRPLDLAFFSLSPIFSPSIGNSTQPPILNESSLDENSDATIDIAIWSNIEMGLGITAGSLATLRPLVRKLLGTYSDKEHNYSLPKMRSGGRRGKGQQQPLRLASRDNLSMEHHDDTLRDDKVIVTTTAVRTHQGYSWTEGPRSPGGDSQEHLRPEDDANINVHQTFNVTVTSSRVAGK